ncbi:MAG: class II aldolase/adducin family protein [Candidatus Diapherotrites archaeon]
MTYAKFKTIFEKKEIPENSKNKMLLNWCKKFSENNLAPCRKNYSCGNLSFRTRKGMIITASGIDLMKITEKGLIEVISCNKKNFEVKAIGLKEPSSESFIHFEIYKKRKEINAVFHGHNEMVLKNAEKFNFTETKKFQEFGTIDLLKEITKILKKNNFILLKKHGFISMGKTLNEAGKLALKMKKMVKK